MTTTDVRISDTADIAVYRFPTPEPEADGTLRWDATTAVTLTLTADGVAGLGWTYTSAATAAVLSHELIPALRGHSPFDIPGCRTILRRACRNLGTTAIVAHALSAADIALWDLKARLLQVPLPTLFGSVRPSTPIYGSGGFTTLTDDQLAEQIAQWQAAGCAAVKIKIGQDRGGAIARDLQRTAQAVDLLGAGHRVMVDANGAYPVGVARRVGAELDRLGVSWFEEPVTSDDPHGLALVRDAVHCDVAAGEYVYRSYDAAALVPAVDCL
jgi:L-alanine-DL-glutamate epimerase-like enolase superfamily enzyme